MTDFNIVFIILHVVFFDIIFMFVKRLLYTINTFKMNTKMSNCLIR
jgi:hypothetical protein